MKINRKAIKINENQQKRAVGKEGKQCREGEEGTEGREGEEERDKTIPM